MLEHHDRLNGSATAFIRAFSDLIKDSTSHLATREDLDRMAANMATKDDIANMVTREDLNERIDTTNQNMQAQFARQEEKIAEINRNMQAQFVEQEKKITEINQKLDRISR